MRFLFLPFLVLGLFSAQPMGCGDVLEGLSSSPLCSLFALEEAYAETAVGEAGDLKAAGAAAAAPIFSEGAGSPAQKEPKPPGVIDGLFRILPLFGIVFFIFYFLVLRPQEKKERDHHAFLQNLKVGQSVVTLGGIVGRVSGIEEETVAVEIAQGVRVKFEKSSLLKEHGGEILISKSGPAETSKRKAS